MSRGGHVRRCDHRRATSSGGGLNAGPVLPSGTLHQGGSFFGVEFERQLCAFWEPGVRGGSHYLKKRDQTGLYMDSGGP